MVTVAPRTTAPVGSVTVPVTVPEVAPACPAAGKEQEKTENRAMQMEKTALRMHVRIDDLRIVMDCPWGFRLGAEFCLGESRREGRRPIGELQDEALPGNGGKGYRNEAGDLARSNGEGDHDHGLHRMVGRDAQRAIVIGLAGGMRVGDLQNAGHQHQRDTEDSQERNPGKPRSPLCRYKTHVLSTITRVGRHRQRCPSSSKLGAGSQSALPSHPAAQPLQQFLRMNRLHQ